MMDDRSVTPGRDSNSPYIDTTDQKYKYYSNLGNNKYMALNEVKINDSLPPGMYTIKWDNMASEFIFQLEILNTDKLYHLPILELDLIKNDIFKFWKKEEKFNNYGLIHKRGILLYGKPGCGKSCAIDIIINNLIFEQKGIVFKISSAEELELFIDHFSSKVKIIEPKRKVVVILEDIDGLFEINKSVQTNILNLLDGINQCNNIVYLATTNYPERLEERILNRPSRFDKRYEFRIPSYDVRKAYLNNSLKEDDKKNIDLEHWLESSEGLTLSHLRELIVSVIILENDFENEIKTLKDMQHLVSSSSYKDNQVGFTHNKKIKKS